MYLLFVDESGTPPKRVDAVSRPHFVIAGVAIPEGAWRPLAEAFQSLKQESRYRIVGEIKWRHFGELSKDKINNISHLTREDRLNFRRDLFSLITNRPEIKLLACVAHAPSAYATSYVSNEEDLYESTYKPITERFQYLLQESGTPGNPSLGVIISDHRGRKQDERLIRHHQKLIYSTGSTISTYANLIESLFLAASHQSVGIQLADMVAGAIGRAFNSKDPTYARMLKPAFRKNKRGDIQGWGLVRFPRKWIRAPGEVSPATNSLVPGKL